MLGRNTRLLPNVRLYNIGLQATDQRVPLYAGAVDAITASIYQRDGKNTAASEMVDLRASGTWLAEQGISQIDVLKIDAEGCELAILEHLVDVLPTVKVLYVEYDTTSARRPKRLEAPVTPRVPLRSCSIGSARIDDRAGTRPANNDVPKATATVKSTTAKSM